VGKSGKEKINNLVIMLIGEFLHKLDEKGRLSIPAKFKSELKKGAVVTRGLDNCLSIYPLDEWKKLAEKLAALPISNKNSRAFTRFMLSGATDVKLDKSGRILVAEYLRNFASLKTKKQVIITGLQNRLEIWDETEWKKYRKNTDKDSSQIAEQLDDLNI
jgi:MraZ protein